MDPDDTPTTLRVASFACYLDTAKDNIVHRSLSSQDNTTTINKPNPPFTIKFSNPSDHLRVDSFSYLNNSAAATDNKNFAFEAPGPILDPTAAFTFSQSCVPKDSGEISVFSADKYFNMKLDNHSESYILKHHRHHHQPPPPPPPPPPPTNVKPASPSLTSEVSSWNSQTALIPDIKEINPTKPKRAFGKKIFTGFGCKGGPCFAKRSNNVNKNDKPRAISHSEPSHLADKKAAQILDESRHSIEVFGSGTTKSKGSNIAANMGRKLSMLTWDAIPKAQNVPTSTIAGDDMASEASSDLFEIENISGSMFPLLNSETVDGSSCMMSPTSNYAPSEASIQWSVATASAAALSEYNDEMGLSFAVAAADVVQRNNSNTGVTTDVSFRINGGGKELQKGRAGGLLGCKSEKWVDVAENVCQKKNQGVDLSVPFGRSQACNGRVKIDYIDTLQFPIKSHNSHP